MSTTPTSIETNGTPPPRFVWPQRLRGRWGATLLAAAVFAVWTFFHWGGEDAKAENCQPTLESILAAAYPVVDVTVVYGLALFLFRNLGASLRSDMGFLLAGMLLLVVAVVPVHRIR